MQHANFSLEQAQAIIPALRTMLREANVELDELILRVQETKAAFDKSEMAMDGVDRVESAETLRLIRDRYQRAINDLSREQNHFLQRLDHWVERISSTGVILRNMREGLVDFPAEKNGFTFYLCWKMEEDDISHWHLQTDGFIGRKPMISLSEYC